MKHMQTIYINQSNMSYDRTEQINTLRSNIQFAGNDKKVLLVTSCIQGEGKSSISLDLATSLAALGKNVLLIDADLRASVMVGKINGQKPKVGLSHVLSGQNSIKEAVYATNTSGLYVVLAGPVPPNPTELISATEFTGLIQSLRKIYDYIIVDSAPLGMVVDAAILAKNCDGSILVIESGVIKKKFAQKVKEHLVSTGCPLLGVVLTKMKSSASNRYYGRYYGKYYGKYEKKYQARVEKTKR